MLLGSGSYCEAGDQVGAGEGFCSAGVKRRASESLRMRRPSCCFQLPRPSAPSACALAQRDPRDFCWQKDGKGQWGEFDCSKVPFGHLILRPFRCSIRKKPMTSTSWGTFAFEIHLGKEIFRRPRSMTRSVGGEDQADSAAPADVPEEEAEARGQNGVQWRSRGLKSDH